MCTSRWPRRPRLGRVGAHIDISVPIQTTRWPALRARATTIPDALNRCCATFKLGNTTVDATDSGAIRGRIEGAGEARGAHTPRHVRSHVGPQRARRWARARPPQVHSPFSYAPPFSGQGWVYILITPPAGPLSHFVLHYYWPLVPSLETTSLNGYQLVCCEVKTFIVGFAIILSLEYVTGWTFQLLFMYNAVFTYNNFKTNIFLFPRNFNFQIKMK